MRLLDLFCGRWGWSRAFALERGREVREARIEAIEEAAHTCADYAEWLKQTGAGNGGRYFAARKMEKDILELKLKPSVRKG